MDDGQTDRAAFDTAERLLGAPLVLPLGPGEPPSGADFRRLATRHTFGDSWTRTGLDVRSRALVSVTIAATLGTREPLRGQLRIALNNGVTKDEIVDLFVHLEAYAGAARAFDSYQIALEIFAETRAPSRRPGPQAGAARQRYRAVRCQACAAASRAGQVLRREATALRVWVSPASRWSWRTGASRRMPAGRIHPRRERARRHRISLPARSQR